MSKTEYAFPIELETRSGLIGAALFPFTSEDNRQWVKGLILHLNGDRFFFNLNVEADAPV
jgi:hypothetical protein